jgi:type IV pilus assembly protein PilO
MRVRGKEIYLIAALIAIVLVVAWYFLLLSPLRSDIKSVEQSVAKQEVAVQTAQNEVQRLEQYKKTAPQSRADLVRLTKAVPESEVVPSLIIDLGKTADAAGVDLVNITREMTQAGEPYGVQAVTLEVEGRFFDVEDFLYRVESYVAFRNSGFRATGRLVDMASLSVSADTAEATSATSPVLNVSIKLNAYLWNNPSSPTGTTTAVEGGAQ